MELAEICAQVLSLELTSPKYPNSYNMEEWHLKQKTNIACTHNINPIQIYPTSTIKGVSKYITGLKFEEDPDINMS